MYFVLLYVYSYEREKYFYINKEKSVCKKNFIT